MVIFILKEHEDIDCTHFPSVREKGRMGMT